MIFIRLKGGLGNQLFQLAMLYYIYSQSRKHMIIYDFSYYNSPFISDTRREPTCIQFIDFLKMNIHGICIQSFSSMLSFVYYLYSYTPFCVRVTDYSLYHNQSYVSSSRKTIFISGNFQERKIVLDGYISILNRFFGELISNSNVIVSPKATDVVVHYRRGDYLSNSKVYSTLGALNDSYFVGSLCKMQLLSSFDRIIIVSDGDTSSLRSSIRQCFQLRSCEILSFKGDEIESFLLLAQAYNIILSNSSYSWWSATVNPLAHAKIVVYPKPWYFNAFSTLDNACLVNWHCSDSTFLASKS